jgi:2,4-dienoyl-CoA reductase-like NADH-dependent reductase (Old Yellow Enzyme family)
MYVHPSGKCHPEMTGIYDDDLIPHLAKLANVVHQEGGKVAVQINHGGMQCSKDATEGTIAPSIVEWDCLEQSARAMTEGEIEMLVDAFGQAARRCREAGFDAVQLHGAHGYLINQFLSPAVNWRTDKWGGDFERRMRFLRAVVSEVQQQVGTDYPVFIKLGMMDGIEGGLTLGDGVRVAAELAQIGLDAVEVSAGIGGKIIKAQRKGIRAPQDEAYLRPLAQAARKATTLPLALVGGMRSRGVMEQVLASGDADFISLCRPLISEPDFPNILRARIKETSRCISSSNCWAEGLGEGISCKCPLEKVHYS